MTGQRNLPFAAVGSRFLIVVYASLVGQVEGMLVVADIGSFALSNGAKLSVAGGTFPHYSSPISP